MNWVEWTKGICYKWSRGRHFSPSLTGDRYMKLSSQKRSPGRNLGEHCLVRRSGTTSRGTALLVLRLRTRSFHRTVFWIDCSSPLFHTEWGTVLQNGKKHVRSVQKSLFLPIRTVFKWLSKNQTKAIVLTNHNRSKERDEPMTTPSNYL